MNEYNSLRDAYKKINQKRKRHERHIYHVKQKLTMNREMCMSNSICKCFSASNHERKVISMCYPAQVFGKKIKNVSKSALYFLNNRRLLPTDYLGRNKTNQTTKA